MQYPSKSQYVQSGSTVPITGVPAAPDNATPTADPNANTQAPADGDTNTPTEPPAEN